MDSYLEFLIKNRSGMVSDLRDLVEMESPSTDKGLLDHTLEFIEEYIRTKLGGRTEIVRNDEAGNSLIAHFGPDDGRKPVVILTHYDTVWPEGTLKQMPFEIRNGRITGPGVFDMKGGLIQGFWAFRALNESGGIQRPVVLLCTSDEEIGSRSSRKLIEDYAAGSECVLVLEASENGALKTARKGVGMIEVEVTGRAAHSGLEPEKGISAIDEISRIILELHSMNDPASGTTVSVGTLKGGTRRNVIAAHAEAEIDVRISSRNEGDRIMERIMSIKPHNKDAKVRITGGISRPPMERTVATSEIFNKARAVGRELGLDLQECSVGGASDGNFCAAMGVPVLDGLGAVGAGAHAPGEYLVEETMPQRAALLALLMERI